MKRQTQNAKPEPPANRHASISDALREIVGVEWRLLPLSCVRIIALPALVFVARGLFESSWPLSAENAAYVVITGVPIALLILLGWADEVVPL